jgi:hypothetical protein
MEYKTYNFMDDESFIFCLEGVPDVDTTTTTEVVKKT